MTLMEVLKKYTGIKDVKVGYFGENQKDFDEKKRSDISLICFTPFGLEKYDKVLNLPIKQVTENSEIMLATNGDKVLQELIKEFWDLFTLYGGFKWDGSYNDSDIAKVSDITELIQHRKYFEFTSERPIKMVNEV